MFVDPTLGNVTIFAGNFAPRSWMLCQGQLLAISGNEALFALIGTTYGGDGITIFALPDLRSRVAIHSGQGPALSNHFVGEQGGNESITLTTNQLPVHTHAFASATGNPGASGVAGTTDTPVANVTARTAGINSYNSNGAGKMVPTVNNITTATAGGNQPFNMLSPVLAINYIIAVEGIFPSRN
jgi:microcystin-dependent protein